MPDPAPSYTAEIAAIEAQLASTVASVSTDGQSATFKRDSELRRRLAELRAMEGATLAPKPRIRGINIAGAW